MSDWPVAVLVLLVIGVNPALWGTVGLLRWCDEALATRRWERREGGRVVRAVPARITTDRVAVLVAAHDEEVVITDALRALAHLVPAGNVHVVSDWSSDRTVELVRAAGANVLETASNVGKAGALALGIRAFHLTERFDAVTILDADTRLDPAYFAAALPLLDDPRVAAVAGCAQTRWHPEELGWRGAAIVAHRQRVYTLTQRLLKYGQTWRGLSATHIVPGFASTYRSRALSQIDVAARGLVIEDFNMTFELSTKRLGRVAFTPRACAYTQDPSSYREYVRQTRRWSLGLWQTVRHHHPRHGVLAGALWLVLAELLTSSVVFVLLPVVLLVLGGAEALALTGWGPAVELAGAVSAWAFLGWVLLGVVVPDYLLTCCVALLERRRQYLWLGLWFLPMRVTDAWVALSTLPRAWTERSAGPWASPTRRAVGRHVASRSDGRAAA